ncbi:MAG: hypothetical protein QOE58_1323, partial [Actinomycetota bacterium]|nr:hypothetical protein [Actinomycetota bacterium]
QASRTYDLEFRVQLPPGQHVVSYTFGESSGMFGAGPNGLIGIRTLTTGTVLDAQHPLRLSWKPALTGHRYLVLAIELQAPGGRGSGEQTSVGEFQITP